MPLPAILFITAFVFLAMLVLIAIIGGLEVLVVSLVIQAIKKQDAPLTIIDPRSGKGKMSELPKEIAGWNWAAAFVPMVWGIYHRSWFFLLNFIPGFKLVWWIVLGLKGNEWAWRKNEWESVEKFKRAQAHWRPVGIAFFILQLLWVPYFVVISYFSPLFNPEKKLPQNEMFQLDDTTSTFPILDETTSSTEQKQ